MKNYYAALSEDGGVYEMAPGRPKDCAVRLVVSGDGSGLVPALTNQK